MIAYHASAIDTECENQEQHSGYSYDRDDAVKQMAESAVQDLSNPVSDNLSPRRIMGLWVKQGYGARSWIVRQIYITLPPELETKLESLS